MFGRLDFTVYDAGGQMALVVEVKRIFDKNAQWATKWRCAYMEDAPASLAECSHMLVTPERIYVWAAGALPGASPTCQLDASQHLGGYFRRVDIPTRDIEARAFERIVSWWLRDLSHHSPSPTSDTSTQELERAGLLPALAGARIIQEDAA